MATSKNQNIVKKYRERRRKKRRPAKEEENPKRKKIGERFWSNEKRSAKMGKLLPAFGTRVH